MSSRALAGETETFARYGVTDRLEVGFGYLWRPKVVRPLASYTFAKETAQNPSITGGLLFDSLGGGRQGLFAIAGKSFRGSTPVAGYLGTAVITNEDRPRLIAGLNISLSRSLTSSAQFDGKYSHVGLTAGIGNSGKSPVRLGVVYSKNRYFGPLIALSLPVSH